MPSHHIDAELRPLLRRLRHLIASGLGFAPTFFDGFMTQRLHTLSYIRYSEQLSNADQGLMSCCAHTDWGFCTPQLSLAGASSVDWSDSGLHVTQAPFSSRTHLGCRSS